jgi:type I restriction enzyme, S subunit
MIGWENKSIGTLGKVITGKTPPKDDSQYFEHGDRLFVSPKDLDDGHLYVYRTQTQITDKALLKFKNQVLPKNAVMFTSLSFGFGKMGISSEECLTNQQINSIVVNKNNHYRFVFYLLKAYKPIIFSYNSGIDTPIVPKSVFEKIEVKVPELSLQQKIAATLTAYDDLIENNKRRIALLEKMAEEIYREWFVRMRFPGHEQVAFHKGIPEGWTSTRLNDVTTVIKRGISPKYDEFSALLVVNQKCIRNGNINLNLARHHDTRTPSEKFLQYADILINSTGVGTLGRVSIIEFQPEKLTVDSHVTICRADSRKINKHFLASSVRRLQDYFELMAIGSTGQVELGREVIAKTEIILPSLTIQEKYADIVDDFWKQKNCLLQTLQNLEQTRDRLLPRLISGKLAVEDLDIQFPPSMSAAEAATHER